MISRVSVTIHELLGDLRSASLDKRDQGDKSERLIAAYLRNDPEWAAKFEDAWLWSEWPGLGKTTDVAIGKEGGKVFGGGTGATVAITHRIAASGIVNDPNDWSREVGDPRYVLDLLVE